MLRPSEGDSGAHLADALLRVQGGLLRAAGDLGVPKLRGLREHVGSGTRAAGRAETSTLQARLLVRGALEERRAHEGLLRGSAPSTPRGLVWAALPSLS